MEENKNQEFQENHDSENSNEIVIIFDDEKNQKTPSSFFGILNEFNLFKKEDLSVKLEKIVSKIECLQELTDKNIKKVVQNLEEFNKCKNAEKSGQVDFELFSRRIDEKFQALFLNFTPELFSRVVKKKLYALFTDQVKKSFLNRLLAELKAGFFKPNLDRENFHELLVGNLVLEVDSPYLLSPIDVQAMNYFLALGECLQDLKLEELKNEFGFRMGFRFKALHQCLHHFIQQKEHHDRLRSEVSRMQGFDDRKQGEFLEKKLDQIKRHPDLEEAVINHFNRKIEELFMSREEVGGFFSKFRGSGDVIIETGNSGDVIIETGKGIPDLLPMPARIIDFVKSRLYSHLPITCQEAFISCLWTAVQRVLFQEDSGFDLKFDSFPKSLVLFHFEKIIRDSTIPFKEPTDQEEQCFLFLYRLQQSFFDQDQNSVFSIQIKNLMIYRMKYLAEIGLQLADPQLLKGLCVFYREFCSDTSIFGKSKSAQQEWVNFWQAQLELASQEKNASIEDCLQEKFHMLGKFSGEMIQEFIDQAKKRTDSFLMFEEEALCDLPESKSAMPPLYEEIKQAVRLTFELADCQVLICYDFNDTEIQELTSATYIVQRKDSTLRYFDPRSMLLPKNIHYLGAEFLTLERILGISEDVNRKKLNYSYTLSKHQLNEIKKTFNHRPSLPESITMTSCMEGIVLDCKLGVIGDNENVQALRNSDEVYPYSYLLKKENGGASVLFRNSRNKFEFSTLVKLNETDFKKLLPVFKKGWMAEHQQDENDFRRILNIPEDKIFGTLDWVKKDYEKTVRTKTVDLLEGEWITLSTYTYTTIEISKDAKLVDVFISPLEKARSQKISEASPDPAQKYLILPLYTHLFQKINLDSLHLEPLCQDVYRLLTEEDYNINTLQQGDVVGIKTFIQSLNRLDENSLEAILPGFFALFAKLNCLSLVALMSQVLVAENVNFIEKVKNYFMKMTQEAEKAKSPLFCAPILGFLMLTQRHVIEPLDFIPVEKLSMLKDLLIQLYKVSPFLFGESVHVLRKVKEKKLLDPELFQETLYDSPTFQNQIVLSELYKQLYFNINTFFTVSDSNTFVVDQKLIQNFNSAQETVEKFQLSDQGYLSDDEFNQLFLYDISQISHRDCIKIKPRLTREQIQRLFDLSVDGLESNVLRIKIRLLVLFFSDDEILKPHFSQKAARESGKNYFGDLAGLTEIATLMMSEVVEYLFVMPSEDAKKYIGNLFNEQKQVHKLMQWTENVDAVLSKYHKKPVVPRAVSGAQYDYLFDFEYQNNAIFDPRCKKLPMIFYAEVYAGLVSGCVDSLLLSELVKKILGNEQGDSRHALAYFTILALFDPEAFGELLESLQEDMFELREKLLKVIRNFDDQGDLVLENVTMIFSYSAIFPELTPRDFGGSMRFLERLFLLATKNREMPKIEVNRQKLSTFIDCLPAFQAELKNVVSSKYLLADVLRAKKPEKKEDNVIQIELLPDVVEQELSPKFCWGNQFIYTMLSNSERLGVKPFSWNSSLEMFTDEVTFDWNLKEFISDARKYHKLFYYLFEEYCNLQKKDSREQKFFDKEDGLFFKVLRKMQINKNQGYSDEVKLTCHQVENFLDVDEESSSIWMLAVDKKEKEFFENCMKLFEEDKLAVDQLMNAKNNQGEKILFKLLSHGCLDWISEKICEKLNASHFIGINENGLTFLMQAMLDNNKKAFNFAIKHLSIEDRKKLLRVKDKQNCDVLDYQKQYQKHWLSDTLIAENFFDDSVLKPSAEGFTPFHDFFVETLAHDRLELLDNLPQRFMAHLFGVPSTNEERVVKLLEAFGLMNKEYPTRVDDRLKHLYLRGFQFLCLYFAENNLKTLERAVFSYFKNWPELDVFLDNNKLSDLWRIIFDRSPKLTSDEKKLYDVKMGGKDFLVGFFIKKNPELGSVYAQFWNGENIHASEDSLDNSENSGKNLGIYF